MYFSHRNYFSQTALIYLFICLSFIIYSIEKFVAIWIYASFTAVKRQLLADYSVKLKQRLKLRQRIHMDRRFLSWKK